MNGALLVDKPSGPTSHDVVAFARRALKTTAIGHTGTLDPLATGLLVLLVGHATRLSRFLVTDRKEYLADVRLGRSTPTYDADPSFRLKAEATSSDPSFRLQAEDIARVLAQFVGTFPQMPPPFSAKKIAGVPAYKKARKNEPVELKPVEVTLHEVEVVTEDRGSRAEHRGPENDDPGLLRLRIVCSAGFYVRSLAHDLGQLLGCGAHLEALRRIGAGPFSVADAVTLDQLAAEGLAAEGRLIGLNALIGHMPAATLTDEGLRRAGNGNTLAPAHLVSVPTEAAGPNVRLLDASGRLLSVAERRADGLLHPLLVLR